MLKAYSLSRQMDKHDWINNLIKSLARGKSSSRWIRSSSFRRSRRRSSEYSVATTAATPPTTLTKTIAVLVKSSSGLTLIRSAYASTPEMMSPSATVKLEASSLESFCLPSSVSPVGGGGGAAAVGWKLHQPNESVKWKKKSGAVGRLRWLLDERNCR